MQQREDADSAPWQGLWRKSNCNSHKILLLLSLYPSVLLYRTPLGRCPGVTSGPYAFGWARISARRISIAGLYLDHGSPSLAVGICRTQPWDSADVDRFRIYACFKSKWLIKHMAYHWFFFFSLCMSPLMQAEGDFVSYTTIPWCMNSLHER